MQARAPHPSQDIIYLGKIGEQQQHKRRIEEGVDGLLTDRLRLCLVSHEDVLQFDGMIVSAIVLTDDNYGSFVGD